MSKSVRVIVLHDDDGEILSVARLAPRPEGTDVPEFGFAFEMPEAQGVLEVELDETTASQPLEDIHRTHRLDIENRRLVREDVGHTD